MLKKILKPILTLFLSKTKIYNKIVFVNFTKNSYGCNPKYITEEIIKQNLPFELVWLVKNPKKEKKFFPKEVKLVKFSSIKALFEFATSKIWVSNSRLNYYIKKGLVKKSEQKYIQTWHGSLGLKKIEADICNNENNFSYTKWAEKESSMVDFLISTSKFDTEIFKKCFWFNKDFLEIGYPRNDIFFLNETEKQNKITQLRKTFEIPEDKKILLYAPTFRDSKNVDVYDIDFDRIINALNKKFNDNFVTLIRLHPHLSRKINAMKNKYPNIKDVTLHPDSQELLLISDVLVTDYSSSIFDFMYTQKPAFIYANDVEDYFKERGFYLSFEQMPFPIAYNNDDLVKIIENFDINNYQQNLNKFMNFKNCFDSGQASKKCVELIKKL